MDKNSEASRVIDHLGGTDETARICEVTKQAVSAWRVHGIPRARLMFLKIIRPDAFVPQPVETEANGSQVREQQN